MAELTELIRENFNYWIYVILMMIGLWAMIAKRNYIKKLIGMSIFQTAIILLYVSVAVKDGATIPIKLQTKEYAAETAYAENAQGKEAKSGQEQKGEKKKAYAKAIDPDQYGNPLPHVLMLTAIVVGVSTLGVALAVAQSIFKDFGTLEEHEILAKLKAETDATDHV